jgi:hypothetical protein
LGWDEYMEPNKTLSRNYPARVSLLCKTRAAPDRSVVPPGNASTYSSTGALGEILLCESGQAFAADLVSFLD